MSLTIEIPEGIVIPDYMSAAMLAQATGSAKRRPMLIGETATIGFAPAVLYMLRQDATTLVVSKDPLAPAVIDVGGDYSWGPPLWRMLEDGANTPDERLALALGMSAKLPCGSCRQGWKTALQQHPPDTESDLSFFKWVVARHNEINVALGRPEFVIADPPA